MTPPHPHPRRSHNIHQSARPLITHDSEDVSSTQLKKGSTFHSPSSPSKEDDPILNISSLPKRSSTTLREGNTSGGDRIEQFLGAIDRSLSGLQSFVSDSQETITAEALPVPSFMVGGQLTPNTDAMDVDAPASPRDNVRKHHASDSGIGSTESSSGSLSELKQETGTKKSSTHGAAQTGINGTSRLASELTGSQQHVLSEYACRQIQKYIIVPIIREEKLKNFHPLVAGLPRRIQRKEITCLRDLEKVLLWLAPKWSATQTKFLRFCETSIQCIHATVEHLNEHDQRRPADRPYTNGYFLDLVEQVRNYAAHLAATRARMGPSDRVELRGGISQTGRPAELVAMKDGKAISLRTMEEVSADDSAHGTKRTSAEIDEELERSMARRRKSAPIEKEIQKCRDCNKVFKRPCDLTKHEKTHTRPWKCNERDCRYFEHGWPTEKERDRHVNDKHSSAPVMHKCQFAPCPYESKRQSNCKQHMEKAHGWTYHRSKNNGKAGSISSSSRPGAPNMPPTPTNSTPGSNLFSAQTPDFRDDVSNFGTPASSHFRTESINGSVMTDQYPSNDSAAFGEMFGPISDFDWDNLNNNSYNPAIVPDHRQSWDSTSSMVDPNVIPSTLMDLPTEDQSIFGNNFDWANMPDNNDFINMNLQLITPAQSAKQQPLELNSKQSIDLSSPSLSPGANVNAMLYSPYSHTTNDSTVDEGYGGDFTQELKPVHDFSLFGTNSMAMDNTANDATMFPELSSYNTAADWSNLM